MSRLIYAACLSFLVTGALAACWQTTNAKDPVADAFPNTNSSYVCMTSTGFASTLTQEGGSWGCRTMVQEGGKWVVGREAPGVFSVFHKNVSECTDKQTGNYLPSWETLDPFSPGAMDYVPIYTSTGEQPCRTKHDTANVGGFFFNKTAKRFECSILAATGARSSSVIPDAEILMGKKITNTSAVTVMV